MSWPSPAGTYRLPTPPRPHGATWWPAPPVAPTPSAVLRFRPAEPWWHVVDPAQQPVRPRPTPPWWTVGTGPVIVDLSGDPAVANWSAVDPTVILGSITINLGGDPALATWSAVDPTVILGGPIDLASLPATAAWSAADPVVMRTRVSQSLGTGTGYTDVNPQQVIRTQQNRVYIFAVDCASYPCEATSQTIRAYRADQDGIPSSFTRMNSAGEPSGIAGWAVGLDSTGIVHVAWTYRTVLGGTLDGLRYAQYNTLTDTWGGVTTVISGGLTDGVGQGMQTISLAVDASDVPHIVYLSGNGAARRVYYRNRAGGTWSAATQLDGGVTYVGNERAWHPNIIFDDTGNRVVALMRGTFNDTNDGTVFTTVYKSGAWQAVVNVSGVGRALTGIDNSTSLMVTPDGRYHLTFVAIEGTRYIRYYYSDTTGDSWSANHPGASVQGTHNPRLGPGSVPSTIRIYGHGAPDGTNHGINLYYFQGAGGLAAWGPWTLIVTGNNFDSSVNARWSRYNNWHRGYLDFAYWRDIYPNDLYYGVEDVSIPVDVAASPAVAAWSAVDPAVLIAGVTTVARGRAGARLFVADTGGYTGGRGRAGARRP